MKKIIAIKPNWPAPINVHAFTTTRIGGVSHQPYDHFNLALHVGDDAAHVLENRNLLKQHFHLPNEPIWLNQVHGTTVFPAANANSIGEPEADACIANHPNQICTIMTADCLPILICNQTGNSVAAIHAGWKGLLAGIIEKTISNMHITPSSLIAWIGPGIRQANFQIGSEVRDLFMQQDHSFEDAFLFQYEDKWLADLYLIAIKQLQKMGVTHIYDCGLCTFDDEEQFFSYRRDKTTGRMATLIWFE